MEEWGGRLEREVVARSASTMAPITIRVRERGYDHDIFFRILYAKKVTLMSLS